MALKKNVGILDRLALATDLPGEALPAQPVVEILGDRRVLVENHAGVTKYGETDICIRVHYGYVRVSGCQLRLAKMTKQQIIICGIIDSVNVCRGVGR